ncbi:hypothetical protein EBR96_04895, partial [bacterium]|nr:hypothetical protein [bacterium]
MPGWVGDFGTALGWARFHNLVAIFIPLSFYLFVLNILKRVRKRVLFLAIFSLVTVKYFAISCFFLSGFIPIVETTFFKNSYYAVAGPLYFIFPLLYGFITLFGLAELYLELKKINSSDRATINILFWGFIFGFGGGATTFFGVFGIKILPLGILGVMVYEVLVGYAITKHELMGIRVAISRSLAFVFTLAFFGIGYLALAFPYIFWISKTIDISFVVGTLAYIGFGAGLFFQKVMLKLQTPLNKKFLVGNYEADEVLKSVSVNLIRSETQEDVLLEIGKAFVRYVELEYVYVLHLDPKSEDWPLESVKYNPKDNSIIKIGFAGMFNRADVLIEEAEKLVGIRSFSELPQAIDARVKDIDLSKKFSPYLVSIRSSERLEAIFIIGPKMTEVEFVEKDFNLFTALIHQAHTVFDRIAKHEELQKALQEQMVLNEELIVSNHRLENARMEMQQLNMELEQLTETLTARVKEEVKKKEQAIIMVQELSARESLSNLTAGIAHEIRNPLGAVKMTMDGIVRRLRGSGRDAHPWSDRMSKERMEMVTGSADKAARVWKWLVETQVMDADGVLKEELGPGSASRSVTLPDDLKDVEPAVDFLVNFTQKCRNLFDRIGVAKQESERVMAIANNMLAYGSASGITKNAFSRLKGIGPKEAESLWYELVERGYLDRFGGVTERFDPELPQFGKDLSPEFQDFIPQLVALFETAPRAKKEPVDIKEALQDVLSIQREYTLGHHIEITTEFTHSGRVNGVKNLIFQTFLNLTKNAFEAMEKSAEKKLVIRTTNVDYKNRFDEPVTGVQIVIRDTGYGMTDDTKRRLKEPFFTTKGVTGGRNAGIGMSIVFDVVEFHGGL